MDNMFSLLQLIIGVYLLYCAAMGKGKIFENDYIKVPRAEYVKKLRILSAISGTILTVTSALEYFGVLVPGTTLGWISWAIGLASIIPMMVYSSKSTDREAAKAGRPPRKRPRPRGSPCLQRTLYGQPSSLTTRKTNRIILPETVKNNT